MSNKDIMFKSWEIEIKISKLKRQLLCIKGKYIKDYRYKPIGSRCQR